MFRLLLLVYTAAILLSPKGLAAEPTRYLCFSRDRDIWIANLNAAGAHKIVTGTDPAISPDGARVGSLLAQRRRIPFHKHYRWPAFWNL